MIDNKKEAERAELHRTIWSIANDLRGSVDEQDFKQYVLGIEVTPKHLESVMVPVPDIDVQKNIVKKLDNFRVLIDDLSQGLSAEISARQKQYEYYRDELLYFDNPSG